MTDEDNDEYDDNIFDDDDDTFSTSAWLLVGITGTVPGVLELTDGRLSFTTRERRLFDVPLPEVSNIVFPWYYFGGGVKFRIGANSYRISFVEPNDTWAIGEGRRAGKAWKSVLVART